MTSARSEALSQTRAMNGAPERPIRGLVDHSTMKAVYVYEAPVRLWHWLTVVAMIASFVIDHLIGKP